MKIVIISSFMEHLSHYNQKLIFMVAFVTNHYRLPSNPVLICEYSRFN